MDGLLGFALLSFTSFFTLMNPFGIMPVFMTMTADLTPQQKTQTATKAMITAFLTLILFAFTGHFIFSFFGVSVDAFRVVGGVIFFMVGFDMLQARLVKTKVSDEQVKKYVNDISITPLAIPMICGPGAITNAIVLMQDADTIQKKLVFFGTIFVVSLITLIGLLGAGRFAKFLGETGNNVLMRIMGLLIMVIAVEFFFSGLGPILRNILMIE